MHYSILPAHALHQNLPTEFHTVYQVVSGSTKIGVTYGRHRFTI